MKHAAHETVLESLVKVTDLQKFISDPTGFDLLRVTANGGGGKIAAFHGVECRLRRQHAALDRQVNAFQPLRVEQSRRVTSDHPAIARHARQRPPTAIGKSLGAIADHLAAGQQIANERVLLKTLQHMLRIEAWVFVIQSGDKSEGNDVVLAAVDPSAAVFFPSERPAHAVHNFAGAYPTWRQLP